MQHIEASQKITVQVPVHLLKDAQNVTGVGITQTITAGLEKLALSATYQKMLALKGRCKVDLDLVALRED